MASQRTRTKTFRIKNEVADWIEGQENFNRVIEDLHSHVESGLLEVSDGEITIKGKCTHQNKAYKDLESMMKCLGGTLEDGIRAFQKGLEDGTLTYRNGCIRSVEEGGELDTRDFVKACEARRKDPEETLERFTRMLRSS